MGKLAYLSGRSVTTMCKRIFFVLLPVSLVITSCIGFAGREETAEPDDIFFDYTITGDEGNDSITVILKFHEFSAYGPIVLFATEALLDGKPMPVDSSSVTGPFFITARHKNDFTGKHSITVTSPDGKKYKEQFSFRPFTIVSGLNDTMSRKTRMMLQLSGIDNLDVMRVLLTDTSFTGEGINRLDSLAGSGLLVSRNELNQLKSGPINMELIKENEYPIEHGNRTGGILSVYYAVRREFHLKD